MYSDEDRVNSVAFREIKVSSFPIAEFMRFPQASPLKVFYFKEDLNVN